MANEIAIRDQADNIITDVSDTVQDSLPPTIPYDRFKAAFVTAVSNNPKLLKCDLQSLKTSLMKCAQDNLLPDNREAALVPFNTKVKGDDGKDMYIDAVQYMPMIQGIRKRALELGGVRISAECVYENDEFDAVLGDDPHLNHKPAPLGKERGAIIGAYAIYKDEIGNIVHREIMSKNEIEAARNVSRAKDGPGWKNFYAEFARKTVARRGSKSVPSLPERLRTIIERDDDYVDFDQAAVTSGRTIDHNPLLDDGRRRSGNASESGRTQISGTRSASDADERSSNSDQPDSKETGGDGAASAQDRRPQDSSSGAPSGQKNGRVGGEAPTPPPPSFSSDVYHSYDSALARMTSPESVKKASDAFWKERNVGSANEADGDLTRKIRGTHMDRAEGKIEASAASDEVSAAIDTAFGGPL